MRLPPALTDGNPPLDEVTNDTQLVEDTPEDEAPAGISSAEPTLEPSPPQAVNDNPPPDVTELPAGGTE